MRGREFCEALSELSSLFVFTSPSKAAFLYGKKLDSTGQTNQLVTEGRGGPKCKDALLSLVISRN